MLGALYEQNQPILDLGGDVAEAKSDEIMIDVMANTILLGWENVGWDGQPVDYSVDAAKKMLALKDFRQLINGFSRQMEAFKAKQEKAQGEA